METPPLSVLCLLVLLGCGGAACGGGSANEAPASPSTQRSAAPPPSEQAPTSSLKRSAVKETIAQGPGAFLQNIVVEDLPVMRDGRFVGFKIKALNPAFRVDLQPGDVVTRVNGIAIEHPEDAVAALRSLEKASALRVDYERDGKARTFELPIIDDGKP